MKLPSFLRKKSMKQLYTSGLIEILFKEDNDKKINILPEIINNEGYNKLNNNGNDNTFLDKY